MKFSRWALSSLIAFFLAAPAAAQFNPGCGAGFCGLQSAGGGGGGSVFNGGKSQANIESSSYPFINVIKTAGGDLKEASGNPLFGAPANPAVRDSDGWPMSTANGWIVQVDMPSSTDRPGNWIQTWDGIGTVQNLITAVAYTITAANNNASATVTVNLAAPVSPNTVTTSQLKVGQCIQLASMTGGTWNTISGNFYKILDVAVGGDPTKVQVDLNSTGLGSFSSGQVKNALRNTTTASATCIGRYVFTPPTNGTFPISQQPGVVSMSAAPDYIRNVAVYHGDDEAVYLAGQVWSPKLIAKLIEGKFGILRSLDLQNNNIEKTINWATRKPTTYAVYNSSRWIPASISPSGMTTTNVGCAYSLTWAGYSLVNNAIVHVFFNADCAGAATLNVGGTGAKNILNNATGALSGGSNTLVKGGVTDSYATLIYKSSLNAWIKTGGDNQGSKGYMTFIPPELFITLCTAVGAHPYVLTPALDDTADWTTNYATYVRDNGPSWMKYIQETTNETFNNSAGFDNNGYELAQELVINGGWNTTTGAPSGTTYSATAVATGATTDITFNVAFTGQVGAYMQLGGTYNGVTGLAAGGFFHVTAINVGGNPNKVTVDRVTSGTWTSGGTAVATPSERYEFVGTQMAKFGKAISDVYSGNTTRYEALLGVQLAAGQSSGSMNSTNATANSPQFVLQGGWAASTYITAVDTSNYIKSSEYGTATETTRVATWAPRQGTGTISGTTLTMSGGTNPNVGDEIAGFGIRIGTTVVSGAGPFVVSLSQSYTGNIFAGVSATMRAQETAYLNASVTGSDQENLNIAVTYWLNIANWANGFGIKKMYAYEGGPDQFALGTSAAVDQFRFYTLQSATWQTLIATVYDSWKFGQYPPVSSQYPSGFTAVFPSQFYFAGSKPRSQAWAMFADIYEPDTGLFTGIKAYNQ